MVIFHRFKYKKKIGLGSKKLKQQDELLMRKIFKSNMTGVIKSV